MLLIKRMKDRGIGKNIFMKRRQAISDYIKNLLTGEYLPYPGSVREIINRITNQAFLFGVIVYPVVLGFYIYRVAVLGWRNIIILQVAIYLGLLLCHIYRAYLSTTFRTLVFLVILAASNIMGFVTWGILGMGMLTAVVVCVFSSIIYGNRIGFIVLSLYTVAIVVIAAGFILGYLDYNFDVNNYATSYYGWGVALISMFVITVLINLTFMRIFSHTVDLLEDMETRTGELQSSKTELEREIAEHKKTEANFQSSQSRYRVLFESANDAIFLMKDGRFVDCNHKTLEMFMCSRDDIIGNTPVAFSPAQQPGGIDSRTAAQARINGAVSGTPQFFEWIHRRLDGIQLETEVSLNRMEVNQEVYILAIVRDISERKRAEREREDLRSQVNQAMKMQAMGTLAGGIAHDFNNILSVIIGNSELLLKEEGALRPESRKDLQLIFDSGLQARDLIRQILTFSRKEKSEKQSVDLVSLLRDSIRMLRPMIPTTISLNLILRDGIAFVMGNPTQIQQILFNICSNSAHAIGSSSGDISIELKNLDYAPPPGGEGPARMPGRYSRVTVTDDGTGIPRDILGNIFDPFFTTKNTGEGTGLGLSVVHGIVVDHGGFIDVSSSTGQGTTFVIYIPLLKEQEARIESARKSGVTGGTERVLLVDDDESVLVTLSKIISNLGYSVTSTGSGRDALNLFSSRPGDFDAVITDRTMSGLTGEKLIMKITEINPHLPVILISGFHDESVVSALEGVRNLRIISKPVVLEELARSIRELLDLSAR